MRAEQGMELARRVWMQCLRGSRRMNNNHTERPLGFIEWGCSDVLLVVVDNKLHKIVHSEHKGDTNLRDYRCSTHV